MSAHASGSVIALLSITGFALSANAEPVEERCAQLGDACLCSEPLRYTRGGMLVAGVDEDPPDSGGSDSKECFGGRALKLDVNPIELVSTVDNADGLDFPGPMPPDYVLKVRSTWRDEHNDWRILGNLPTRVDNETVCSRSYHRFANDLPIVSAEGSEQQIKLQEVRIKQPGSDLNIQHEIMVGSGGIAINYDCDDYPHLDFQLAGRTSWIRHEVCYDFTADSVTTRQRATVIETRHSEIRSCTKKISTPVDFSDYQIANLYLQTGGDPDLAGSRYVTHAIQTRVPLNPLFWPGAARELEIVKERAPLATLGPGQADRR